MKKTCKRWCQIWPPSAPKVFLAPRHLLKIVEYLSIWSLLTHFASRFLSREDHSMRWVLVRGWEAVRAPANATDTRLSNPPTRAMISNTAFRISLQVHVIFQQRLGSYNKWRQLHEHQPSDTRRWSVLFSFQALLLTVLNTAGATLPVGKTKDRDSCEFDVYAQRKRHRCRSLDGLMVCQQAATVILFYDHASL
jgi:hypothetical protein